MTRSLRTCAASSARFYAEPLEKEWRFAAIDGIRVALPVYDENFFPASVTVVRQLDMYYQAEGLFGMSGGRYSKSYKLLSDSEFNAVLAGMGAAEKAEAGDEARFGGRCLGKTDRDLIRAMKHLIVTH